MDIKRGFSCKWVEVEDTKFKIQYMPEELRSEIEAKHTLKDKLDDVGFMKALLDHTILEWQDVKSNGKIVKCNSANKMAMSINHPGIVETLVIKAMLAQTFHPTVAEIVGNLTRPSNTSDNGKEKEAETVAG